MTRMTEIEGVPSRLPAIAGMAHFAGTGPADKCCGDCKHFTWDAELGPYSGNRCQKYREFTGRHGHVISSYNKACKYFEQKEKRKPAGLGPTDPGEDF